MAIKDIFDRPAAPRRLLLCTGPCCDQKGDATELLTGLRARLEAAKLDQEMVGEASCVRRSCLGKCTGEPLAYVHPDEVWYHELSVENLLLILREHVLEHRAVTELVLEDDD
jgi:(2Fe-2S) ferredoxin